MQTGNIPTTFFNHRFHGLKPPFPRVVVTPMEQVRESTLY
jgi:hypothetical protein